MSRPRRASISRPPRTVQAIWLTSVVVGVGAIGLTAQHSNAAGVGPRDVSRLLVQTAGRGARAVSITAAYGSAVRGHWQMIATVDWTAADGSRHAATVLMPDATDATSPASPTAAIPTPGEPLATAVRQLRSIDNKVTPVAVFHLDGQSETFITCAGGTGPARCISTDAHGHTTHPVVALHLVGDLGADAVQLLPP